MFIEDNAFLLKSLFLNFIAPKRLQGNFAHSVDNPVPGQFVGGRTGVQNPRHLAGSPRITGQGRDQAVQCDLTGRDHSDERFYFLGKRAWHAVLFGG